MHVKTIGIYDEESPYASQLMEYLSREQKPDIRIILFTSMEHLLSYIQEHILEVLLISEESFGAIGSKNNIRHILLLSDDVTLMGKEHSLEDNDLTSSDLSENIGQTDTQYVRVFRYQKPGRIEERIKIILRTGESQIAKYQKEEAVQFYGIVSPEGGSGKTTFCLVLGQLLARNQRVLYIDLEDMGSTLSGEENKGSMTELIYLIKQRRTDLMIKLQEMSIRAGEMDIITAVSCFEDLRELTNEDVDFLLQEIRACGVYQKVLFDIGFCGNVAFHIMRGCSRLYGTSLPWNAGHSKGSIYRKNLELAGYGNDYERIEWIDIPLDERILSKSLSLEHLVEGTMGAYINDREHFT